jgi:hypothetical protein
MTVSALSAATMNRSELHNTIQKIPGANETVLSRGLIEGEATSARGSPAGRGGVGPAKGARICMEFEWMAGTQLRAKLLATGGGLVAVVAGQYQQRDLSVQAWLVT